VRLADAEPSRGQAGRAGAPSAAARLAVDLAVRGGADPQRLRGAVAPLLDRPEGVDAASALRALDQRLGSNPQDGQRSTAALDRLQALEAAVVVAGCDGYPARLNDAWPELGAPLWLFARWPAPLPDSPAVAVVGTRHPTLDGLRTARDLGRLLGERGVTVVSGLARGIDQAAHTGALEVGGRTAAVLGTGLDVDYPRGDGALREAIASSGGLLSELPPGAPPHARHFLWRNRIISGLADLTVVVEGRARSGSLQTARMAAAQGREVWAVPGSIHAVTSQGPLALVRDGAHLLTRLDDVLESLDDLPRCRRSDACAHQPSLEIELSADAMVVGRLLGAVPARPGTIAATTGLPIARVLAATSELTARGLAVATARGLVAAQTDAGGGGADRVTGQI
jgi:DNA processing protein